jgi:hypothetical protein
MIGSGEQNAAVTGQQLLDQFLQMTHAPNLAGVLLPYKR